MRCDKKQITDYGEAGYDEIIEKTCKYCGAKYEDERGCARDDQKAALASAREPCVDCRAVLDTVDNICCELEDIAAQLNASPKLYAAATSVIKRQSRSKARAYARQASAKLFYE